MGQSPDEVLDLVWYRECPDFRPRSRRGVVLNVWLLEKPTAQPSPLARLSCLFSWKASKSYNKQAYFKRPSLSLRLPCRASASVATPLPGLHLRCPDVEPQGKRARRPAPSLPAAIRQPGVAVCGGYGSTRRGRIGIWGGRVCGSLWNRPRVSDPKGFIVCPFPLVLGPETQLCMFEPLINARQILINFKVVKQKEEGNNARQIYSCILLIV
jgi:hypothetical protein